MGWLDNSTNNIILDAVLTDYGRQALARNNNSFKIDYFSLADDEVNYGIIKKYGRTVGREKIEKNTPVFEAMTNQNLALKNRLIGIPAPLVYLPLFQLTPDATVALTPTVPRQTLTVTQKLSPSDPNSLIDESIADATFDIYVPSLFLTLDEISTVSPASADTVRTVLYTKAANNTAIRTQRDLQFTVVIKSLSDTTYKTFGTLSATNQRTISTSIRVVGQNSGLSVDIPVTITKAVTS